MKLEPAVTPPGPLQGGSARQRERAVIIVAHVGLDPAQPLLLYTCSSNFVAPREVEFVRRWIAELRAANDPLLHRCGILVQIGEGRGSVPFGVDAVPHEAV